MSWSDKWYPDMLQSLIDLRGNGAQSLSGIQLPAITPIDTVGIIAQIVPPLTRSFSSALGTRQGKEAVSVGHIDDDGEYQLTDAVFDLGDDSATFIGAREFLAGSRGDSATHRFKAPPAATWIGDVAQIGQPMYELYWTNGEVGMYAFCTQAVHDWQRLCDAAASAMLVSAADMSQPIGADELREFFSALNSLCADMDVIAENPPLVYWDQIKGAMKKALDDSATFIGESLAKLSEQIGKQAANITSGFFGEAGLIAIAVAGVAIYIALH